MTSIPESRRRSVPWFQIAGVLTVAVLAAAMWFAWMGWDTEYQTDPVTQVTSGPYETWQVAGCALSLLAMFVAALLAGVRPVGASAALTLGFTAAWTATAAPADETGLYGVGMILLLVGLTAGTTVVAFIVRRLRRRA
jgi:hypothetical protein